MNEQLEFLMQIVERLEKARVPYMLTGSVALAVYAEPRMTRDLDLVIDIAPEAVAALGELFEGDCYFDRDEAMDAARRRGMFNVIHKEFLVKADFIVRKNDPYRATEFERRRRIDIGGVTVSVVSPEDLLLSKLVWAKAGQSELQMDDARRLADAAADLDWPYIMKWAAVLGVLDLAEGMKKK